MKTVGEIGEFGLISRVARVLPSSPNVLEGVGDDCAVLRVFDRLILVSCDMAIENVDFRRHWVEPDEIGWKAAAASLSDIAAMGGTPLFGLVALACPTDTEVSYVEELYKGISNVMSRFGAVIVGGDTSRSPDGITLDITVIGAPTGNRYLRRGGAQVGDLLAVTGFPGQSAAGLHSLECGIPDRELRIAHCRPRPRIPEGQWLCGRREIHAAIDLSDGLVQDARHLCDASHLGVDLQTGLLPVSPPLARYAEARGLNPREFILGGGEDFELAFAMSPADRDKVLHLFHHEFRTVVTVIGEFTDQWHGLRVDGEETAIRGFEHFHPSRSRSSHL